MAHIDGWGTLPSAQALARKYERQATGTPNSLDSVLNQHIAVVKQMRAAFIQAGRLLEGADATTADRFRRMLDEAT
jgi:uridine kinase